MGFEFGGLHPEGKRMRRATVMLTVCLCAVAGCRGGAAQEPYDGVLAAAQRPIKATATVTPLAPEVEPIASEVDVPWAIALLSDAETPAVRKPAGTIVADVEPEAPETIADEAHVHVAVGPRSAEERPAPPKTCSGVVKSRS
jgi:glucose/arabinose dehydrogenase